jgi:hypothetical protein
MKYLLQNRSIPIEQILHVSDVLSFPNFRLFPFFKITIYLVGKYPMHFDFDSYHEAQYERMNLLLEWHKVTRVKDESLVFN